MLDNKPSIDTSWELKWKRSLRKRLINCLARIENDGKPTQELGYELAKAKECMCIGIVILLCGKSTE